MTVKVSMGLAKCARLVAQRIVRGAVGEGGSAFCSCRQPKQERCDATDRLRKCFIHCIAACTV
ncbi:MAG: hypothetical protein QOK10_2301 [Pseudonocardiales bacterium]|nr:hypothetical protein [Pseudonocardiales bacterium]